jgi:hypothetical protein
MRKNRVRKTRLQTHIHTQTHTHTNTHTHTYTHTCTRTHARTGRIRAGDDPMATPVAYAMSAGSCEVVRSNSVVNGVETFSPAAAAEEEVIMLVEEGDEGKRAAQVMG